MPRGLIARLWRLMTQRIHEPNVRSDVVTALVLVSILTESNLWIILLRPVGTQLVEPTIGVLVSLSHSA